MSFNKKTLEKFKGSKSIFKQLLGDKMGLRSDINSKVSKAKAKMKAISSVMIWPLGQDLTEKRNI